MSRSARRRFRKPPSARPGRRSRPTCSGSTSPTPNAFGLLLVAAWVEPIASLDPADFAGVIVLCTRVGGHRNIPPRMEVDHCHVCNAAVWVESDTAEIFDGFHRVLVCSECSEEPANLMRIIDNE